MKTIESLEQWNELALRLTENGWGLWQTQFDADNPEGFHVWFWKTGKPNYEVVTYNKKVQAAISKYRLK